MYVVAKDNKIIDAFFKSTTTKEALEEMFPGHEILKSDFGFPKEAMVSNARICDGKVALKVSAIITLSKNKVKADGKDEVRAFVQLNNLLPTDNIEEVLLSIDEALLPVPIIDGYGYVDFSTEIKGFHILKMATPDIVCLGKAVEGI